LWFAVLGRWAAFVRPGAGLWDLEHCLLSGCVLFCFLAGDSRPVPAKLVPQDWANLQCFTRIHINGRPSCRLIVWKI
jgi:hypothetical protein